MGGGGQSRSRRGSKKDSKALVNGVSYTNASVDEGSPDDVKVGDESIQSYVGDKYSFMNDDDHYNSNYLKDFKKVQKQGTISGAANNLAKLPSF